MRIDPKNSRACVSWKWNGMNNHQIITNEMNAIHIIMATSTSANPHNAPNEHLENLARKRKLSAVTFLIFGVLLIIAGSLLASSENGRFSISFITFGIIGILSAFMYWVSAERILIALRKYNAHRIRQMQFSTSNIDHRNFEEYIDLPNYEQSLTPHLEIPPSYDEAIKIKSSSNDQQESSAPIHSISLSIDQQPLECNPRINNK